MVLTEDGFKCKRGETMWAIGVTFPDRKYRPLRVKAHSRGADYNHDGLKVWKDIKNCIKECDLRNSRPKNK